MTCLIMWCSWALAVGGTQRARVPPAEGRTRDSRPKPRVAPWGCQRAPAPLALHATSAPSLPGCLPRGQARPGVEGALGERGTNGARAP